MTSRDAALFLGLSWALVGCQPDIGDPCQLPSDCSLRGDRICDTTLPGGYCTKFNCEPGSCPDESVCVAYNAVLSGVEACADRQGGSRLLRTFCMKKCQNVGDCRSQYACVDIARANPWQAEVVEFGNVNTKVCTVPFDGAMIPDDRAANVCVDDGGASFPPPSSPPARDGSLPALPDARVDASSLLSDAAPEAGPDAPLGDARPEGDASVDASMDGSVGDARSDVLDAAVDVSGE